MPANPYGAVPNAIGNATNALQFLMQQHAAQTANRGQQNFAMQQLQSQLDDRGRAHELKMTGLGIDKAKTDHEIYLTTPIPFRDALPKSKLSPEQQAILAQKMNEVNIGGMPLGDIPVMPGKINEILGQLGRLEETDRTITARAEEGRLDRTSAEGIAEAQEKGRDKRQGMADATSRYVADKQTDNRILQEASRAALAEARLESNEGLAAAKYEIEMVKAHYEMLKDADINSFNWDEKTQAEKIEEARKRAAEDVKRVYGTRGASTGTGLDWTRFDK